jgi:hypothetical protein
MGILFVQGDLERGHLDPKNVFVLGWKLVLQHGVMPSVNDPFQSAINREATFRQVPIELVANVSRVRNRERTAHGAMLGKSYLETKALSMKNPVFTFICACACAGEGEGKESRKGYKGKFIL